MANWRKTIKIKHLFTKNEDYESLQKSMNAIANVLEKYNEFDCMDFDEFRNLPEQRTLTIANDILNDMYNIADMESVWIE